MPLIVCSEESYPGNNLSLSQLLDAAKRKMQCMTVPEESTIVVDPFEIDHLERDASELLRLVRCIKNTFAPINRIPQELLTLIPRYWSRGYVDKDLITLTHVCQRWRKALVTDSSLWTYFECTNPEKTRVCVERSGSSPLEIVLNDRRRPTSSEDAFRLVIPHIGRVGALRIAGGKTLFHKFTINFSRHVPLLKYLCIDIVSNPSPVLNRTLFNGNPSSLRTLILSGVAPYPWKNLSNLTTFVLGGVHAELLVTQLLDLFAGAPLLRSIELCSIPDIFDAPEGRVVSLPRLEILTIVVGRQDISLLLDHLSVPTGASLHLSSCFTCDEPPLPKFLPWPTENLQNILHLTSAYLNFNNRPSFAINLSGPSGVFHAWGHWQDRDRVDPAALGRELLRSLDCFPLSRIQTLAVTDYRSSEPEGVSGSPPHHILGVIPDVHTIFLNRCNNLPFILSLDPHANSSNLVLCPRLATLIIYVEERKLLCVRELVGMAKERRSRGFKLRSITVVTPARLMPEREVFERLGEHVALVEHRIKLDPPVWDRIPAVRTAARG